MMKELNLYPLAGLFMELQKATLHRTSRKKPMVLFLVYLLASGVFTVNYNPKETIAFCKNIDNAQIIEQDGNDFGLTSDEICNIVHELIPIIEELAGKKFNTLPKLEFATRNKIENALAYELMLQFKNLMEYEKKQIILKKAQSKAKKVIELILAKYGFIDKTIYLSHENINAFAKKKQFEKIIIKTAVTLLIAHEMAHALQDQHANIANRFKTISSFEQLDALEATFEGHAIFIQDQIENHLFNSQRQLLNKGTGNENPVTDSHKSIEEIHVLDIYTNGKKFIEYWFNKGGNQKIWEVLLNPPTRTSIILNPETYTQKRMKELDYISLLKGLEHFFGPGSYTTENTDIPVLKFSSILSVLNSKNKEFINKITHFQLLRIFKKSTLYGTVSFFEITDKTCGDQLKLFLEKNVGNNLQKLNRTQDFAIQKFPKKTIDKNETIPSKTIVTVKNKRGKPQRIAFVLLAENQVVLEINDEFGKLTNKEFDGIIKAVSERYYKMKS